jgi:amino acid adenylation domain-containing protein
MVGNVDEVWDLSPLQQGLIFHSTYAPESRAYWGQFVWRLEGELDVPEYRRSWQRILSRHPALRVSFLVADTSRLVQVVWHQVELPFAEEDWRDLAREEQDERLEGLLRDDRARGFDHSRPPLMRLALLRLGRDRAYLVWSFHHALLDGWSMGTVLREVAETYHALRQGREPSLAPVRPYSDFLGWLRRQDLAGSERFWRSRLAGFARPTELRVERPGHRDVHGGWADQTVDIRLGPAITTALREHARAHRVTPNTLLESLWAVVLARYGGRPDVVFGSSVAVRPVDIEGAESIVGLLLNTLPIRVRIGAAMTLPQLLADRRQDASSLLTHAHAPLAAVQSWSELPKGLPLFGTVIALANYPSQLDSGTGGTALAMVAERSFARTHYPLVLRIIPDAGLDIEVAYDSRVYDPETVARLAAHLGTLLEGVARNPGRRLSDLPLLDEEERRLTLVDWNQTARVYPRERCIHDLVAERAARTPEANAVVFGERSLSYGELETRANQLANWLRRLDVGPEVLVGVGMERSVEMMVALLGVLKAGGAYLPLDPGYPEERLSLMLRDAGVEVLLTQERWLDRLPQTGVTAVCLDRDWSAIAEESTEAPATGATAESLVYVMYTSGSTGIPKGVAISHRSVVRLVCGADYVQVTPEDRLGQASTVSFDAATFEIWGALVNGACLVGVESKTILSPVEIEAAIQERRITILFLTTALFHQLAHQAPTIFHSLRCCVVGGDALSAAASTSVLSAGPPEHLINGYGPTESTTFATWHEVRDVQAGSTTIPIGRPISNTRAYVLDADLGPAPIGVPGELYLAGDGLARGYWKRPGLTAERFVPSPFGLDERLYRTGDLCRTRSDGTIEFLGRLDDQVKIRGFRIELREVEAVIRRYPAVRAAAVVAREEIPTGRRLVAYVVLEPSQEAAVPDLRAFLVEQLPDYMVPSVVVVVSELPLGPTGKVNRLALPPPAVAEERTSDFVAPRTPVEKELARIWADVLHVEQVGVGDDFLDLGGDSLGAVQVVSRIRIELGATLPVSAVFESSTLESLAAEIQRFQDAVTASP